LSRPVEGVVRWILFSGRSACVGVIVSHRGVQVPLFGSSHRGASPFFRPVSLLRLAPLLLVVDSILVVSLVLIYHNRRVGSALALLEEVVLVEVDQALIRAVDLF
jgi:hypothetical protein